MVFRRGPARKTLVLSWNLEDDTFAMGQWFLGRIYERRCDLSPDGELLACFAAKYRKPLFTWTAISRPPYLTALALWPKGDAWAGGGLFESPRDFRLNHRGRPGAPVLPGDAPLPRKFTVSALDPALGMGEDLPILSERLLRDGWQWVVPPGSGKPAGPRLFRKYDPPRVRALALTRGRKSALSLRVLQHGVMEQGGRWYIETAEIVDALGGRVRDFGRIDWADADHNGDVLLARNGRLERLDHRKLSGDGEPAIIADLNGLAFEPVEAPEWATSWKAPSRLKFRKIGRN